jgi:hypothetical protein
MDAMHDEDESSDSDMDAMYASLVPTVAEGLGATASEQDQSSDSDESTTNDSSAPNEAEEPTSSEEDESSDSDESDMDASSAPSHAERPTSSESSPKPQARKTLPRGATRKRAIPTIGEDDSSDHESEASPHNRTKRAKKAETACDANRRSQRANGAMEFQVVPPSVDGSTERESASGPRRFTIVGGTVNITNKGIDLHLLF